MPVNRSSRLFFGIVSNYLHFGALVLANLAIIPLMLKYLGKNDYGIWVTILSFVGYVGVLEFGGSFAISKYVSEYYAQNKKEELDKLISTALVVFSALGSIALLIVFGLSFFLAGFMGLTGRVAEATNLAFLIAGINLAISFPSNVFGSIIIGHQQLAPHNFINISGVIVNYFLLVVALWLGFRLEGVAAVLLFTGLFLAIVRLLYVKYSFRDIDANPRMFDKQMFYRIFSFSIYMFILSIGSQIVLNTDNIVIAKILGIGVVAAYSIAFRMNQVASAFVSKLSDAFFPFFSELHAIGDREKLKTYYFEATRLTTALATPIFVILIFWGEKIIKIWVGAEYFVGWPVFYLFAIITLFSSVVHVGGIVLQGMGRVRQLVLFNLIEAGLNLILSIIFAYRFGVFGVALGTVIALTLSNFWYVPYFACRELNTSLFNYFLKSFAWPFVLGGILTIFIFPLDIWIKNVNPFIILLKIIIILAVYGVIFVMVGLTPARRLFYLEKLKGVKLK